MPVSLSIGGPKVTFDVTEPERAIAEFCANNTITTQAQYDTTVNGIDTVAEVCAAMRKILKCARIG